MRLRLDTAYAPDGHPAWRAGRADAHAVFAVNAGQFLQTLPWAGVVLDGRRYLSASHGRLSSTVVIDSSGAMRIVHGDSASMRGVGWAFQ